MNIEDSKGQGKIQLPFGVGVYEPTLILSMVGEKSIDLNSLGRIRKNFVQIYFKDGNDKKYPNVLFDFQRKILKAGHIEAYNHWILMNGDQDSFAKWQAANKDKWTSFTKWFSDNKIQIDDNHRFYNGQY